MSPAPNTEALLSFEDPIELAFVRFLKDRYQVINAYPSRSTATAETPFVEVSLTTGNALRHGKIHFLGKDTQGFQSPDAWQGDLSFRINTQRNTNAELHKSYLGKIRDMSTMHRIVQLWDVASWYRISGISGGASKKFSDDERNLDITEISYTLIFNIHPDAWPIEEQPIV